MPLAGFPPRPRAIATSRAAIDLRPHHDEYLVAARRRVWTVASNLDLRLRQGVCRPQPTAMSHA